MNYPSSIYEYSSYTPHDEKLKFDKVLTYKNSNVLATGEYFPIPYSEESRIRIMRHLEIHTDYLQALIKNRDLTEDERIHFIYLYLSLDAYYKQRVYVIPRKILYPLVMTNAGLKTLKRIKLKSFLESNQGRFIEKPDWFDSTPSYLIGDIGEIFNYNYGMFWMSEDSKDYLLSEIPVNADPEMVEKFTNICNKIIDKCEDFEAINPQEILLKINTSQSIDQDGKSSPNWLLKSSNLHFSTVRSEGKRVLITTGPGQGRDAIINTVEDLNTIQLINENVRAFLKKNFKNFLLLNSNEENKKKFFRRCSKNTSFYCRDIRKEGLTKPKYLLKIMLSALNKRYPENRGFRYTDFFSGPWYEGDKTQRGHGLGMANELTTLLQIMIFFLTNEYIGEEGDYSYAASAFFLNDDAVVFINGDEDDQESFIDNDMFVCESLGILVQKDKSFVSQNCAIFCEMYYARNKPFANDKESYILRESNIMNRSSNILEAKFYAGNMKGSLADIENLLLKAYTFLGYEFSKDEINWPLTLGGIRPFKLRGTDFSLKYLETVSDIEQCWKAYQANQHRKLFRWNKFLKEFTPPIIKLFPEILSEENSRILEKLGVTSDYNLSSLFFRPTKEHKFHSSIKKLYQKRQKIHKSITTFPTFEMFCEDYCTSSSSNVYLDKSFIKRYIKVKLFHMKDFKDPYVLVNPISSYLNKSRYDDYESPDTAWGLFQSPCALSLEKSVFARTRTMNTLSLIDRFEEDVDLSILVFPENLEDLDEFMESYPKPFLTSELVINGNELPIPLENFRNKDLKLRKEVFRKYLDFRELTLSQTRTWREMRNILTFEELYKGFLDFDIDFWDAVDKRRRKGKFDDDSSDKKDNDDDDPGVAYLKELEKYPRITHMDVSVTEKIDSSVELDFDPKSESNEEEVEEEPAHKNMFLISSGPLPEGDLSVYGSEEWIEWFINEETYTMESYAEQDEDLAYASADVIALRRKFIPSNVLDHWNEELRQNVRISASTSWIAFYYVQKIMNVKTKEDDPIEIRLFDEF